MSFPRVLLGELVRPVERLEKPVAGRSYRQIGVRLWGLGAYEREVLDGHDTKYSKLNRAIHNDIIVNKIWARNGSVAIVPESLTGSFCSGEFPLYSPNQELLEPQWFHWITKAKWFWNECDEMSRGTSGKNRIRPERFLEIAIPLPPIDEQRRILQCIENMSTKLWAARQLKRQAVKWPPHFQAQSRMERMNHWRRSMEQSRSDRSVFQFQTGITTPLSLVK